MLERDDEVDIEQYFPRAMKEEMKGIDHKPWVSDGDDAHTFGFDIHFGCCTANFNQGLPKYGIGERVEL